MLTQLAIQDFAIVDHLELDLTGGMTAITGETGAGKSILFRRPRAMPGRTCRCRQRAPRTRTHRPLCAL